MFCIRATSSKKDAKLRRFPLLLPLYANCGCPRYPLNASLDCIDQDSGFRLNNRTFGEKNPTNCFLYSGYPGAERAPLPWTMECFDTLTGSDLAATKDPCSTNSILSAPRPRPASPPPTRACLEKRCFSTISPITYITDPSSWIF